MDRLPGGLRLAGLDAVRALFIAGLGIIVRGAAYALRSGTTDPREIPIDAASAISSVLTPFALGAAIGGLATGRVPFGTPRATSSRWLSPPSIFIGALAVAFCAYLAAVYLAADAARRGEADLVAAFRARALGAGPLPASSPSPASSCSTTTPTGSTTSCSTVTARPP